MAVWLISKGPRVRTAGVAGSMRTTEARVHQDQTNQPTTNKKQSPSVTGS